MCVTQNIHQGGGGGEGGDGRQNQGGRIYLIPGTATISKNYGCLAEYRKHSSSACVCVCVVACVSWRLCM